MPASQSSGTPIDPANVAKIVKGTTTRAEIESMFGKPDSTSLLPDGRRMLNYQHMSTKGRVAVNPIFVRTNMTSNIQTLQVFISQAGVVEDFEFSDQTRDMSQGPGGNTTTAPK